jgi:4-amino-4-deoxy-L-arabinose transferase-like glycosyltransferase
VRAVPAPLGALLVTVLVIGVAWALVVPPGQVPDEPNHIGYTQSIVERGVLPGHANRTLSTEEDVALGFALRGGVSRNLNKQPSWSPAVYRRWTAVGPLPRADGGGHYPQSDNPPLYYFYEALPYVAAGGDFFDRMYAMRIWSVLLLLVTTTGAWLLAGEVFGRRRVLQLAAAGLAGLQPMVTFITAGVNPDAGLIAMWTVALWLGVRIVNRGLTVRDAVALGLLTGFSVWEKATGWGLLPAAAFAMAVGWWRLRARRLPRPGVPLAAGLASLGASAGAWVVTATALGRPIINHPKPHPTLVHPSLTSIHTLREFASYVWQFYLPRLSFQNPFWGMGGGGERVYDAWLRTGWGAFGWLEVRLPEWVYPVLGIASALLILGGVTALARADLRRRVDPANVAFLILATVGLFFVLHWADYTYISLERHAVEQGRYVLPAIALGGLAAAGTVSLLRRRWQAPAVGLLLAALVTLQLASLGVTMERYVA